MRPATGCSRRPVRRCRPPRSSSSLSTALPARESGDAIAGDGNVGTAPSGCLDRVTMCRALRADTRDVLHLLASAIVDAPVVDPAAPAFSARLPAAASAVATLSATVSPEASNARAPATPAPTCVIAAASALP